MADCDPPGLADVAAFMADECDKSHHAHPHSRHHAHDDDHHHNNKRRNRDKGGKILSQLTKALARSSLKDDDSMEEDGKKLTRNQRKKQTKHVAHKEKRTSKSAGGQNGKSTTRVTRSRVGMLPLGFDNLYLSKCGGPSSFMNNDQIRRWLKSVFTPHIENWYHECLSAPANQSRLKTAQGAPRDFAKAVVKEALNQHSSAESQGYLLEKENVCPTAYHLEKKQDNSLTFIEHSTMVACLVVRDGQRDGSFGGYANRRMLHLAAAMLLTSVIMDIRNDLGYFLRLLLDVEEIAITFREEEQALMAQKVSEKAAQSVESQVEFQEASNVLRISSSLFGRMGRALLALQRESDCMIGFRKADELGKEYLVVLAGTADQVREAEQAIQRLMDSLTGVAEEDLMELSARAKGLTIE